MSLVNVGGPASVGAASSIAPRAANGHFTILDTVTARRGIHEV
jgi:hypothetical protein